VNNRLRAAFSFRAACLAIFGIILVQGFAAPFDEIPVMKGYQGPISELAGFPVTQLSHDILGIRPVPIKLAIEHPIASLGEGSRASASEVDELVAGELPFDDTPPPFLRFAKRLERLGPIDAVPPYLGPVLVGPADPDPS
jgi:hypothetical protein